MRKLILFSLFYCFSLNLKAQSPLSVENIPHELLSYASAVIRDDQTITEIIDKANVLYHYRIITTVLNENGDRFARMGIWHNRSRNIKFIKGFVYNEYGKQVSKFSDSDFQDDDYVSDASLFEDVKMKHYKPSVTTYPYTIEYNYDIRSKQSLLIDSWYSILNKNIAVQHSSYQLICPAGLKLSFKETNYNGNAVKGITNDGKESYLWQVNNLKALRDEPYSRDEETFVTSLKIAPQDFIYEGITGNYSNWNELGKWIYDKLLIGRTKLSPQTEDEIKALTKDAATAKEKARKIYEYMQHKTRYISIQIGIGGYQPFQAQEVDMANYGDCKALVNYTRALLNIVNIDSYYCIVKSGSEKRDLLKDFASMDQADHVILCLPFKNDTTWLECTSKSMPFGFLGSFTDDRNVLACTPEGGKILHTPKYAANQNREEQVGEFTITKEGNLTGSMNTNFTGRQYEYRDYFLNESNQDRIKNIVKEYPINNMEIENLSFEPNKKELPDIKELVKFKAPEYASADNGKLIFMVNAANRVGEPLREMRNRLNQLYINRGFTDEEKLTYTVPAGFINDNAPLNVEIHKKFGNYKATVSYNGNQIIYNRTFQLLDGTYSKEDYNEFVDFYQSIYDADHYTVTLVKK